jgi:hypothetical protein
MRENNEAAINEVALEINMAAIISRRERADGEVIAVRRSNACAEASIEAAKAMAPP